jgi:hypothetical protein
MMPRARRVQIKSTITPAPPSALAPLLVLAALGRNDGRSLVNHLWADHYCGQLLPVCRQMGGDAARLCDPVLLGVCN